MSEAPDDKSVFIILIPVYNDWAAVKTLLVQLDQEMRRQDRKARILLIDDGSTEPVPDDLCTLMPSFLLRIDVLCLRRNLGHQRAIAIGIAYVEANLACAGVVIMDGDGEDLPADVPRLLDRLDATGGQQIVFAERTRRSEGLKFTIFYALYRYMHLILTGERVRVGNFSVVPAALLPQLVVVSDLWNHYAAAVFKSRLPFTALPTHRGRRYEGQSRMNFVGLGIHGLSAMSVFGDRIGVRLLVATLTLTALVALLVLLAFAIHFATGWIAPVWAVYALGLVLVITLQLLMVSIAFCFLVLAGRDNATFLPLRDHAYFVRRVRTLFPGT